MNFYICLEFFRTPDLFGKTKSLGRESRSIRRSWSISCKSNYLRFDDQRYKLYMYEFIFLAPARAQTNSPILKSYTILQPEESLSSFNASTGLKTFIHSNSKA